MSTTTFTTAPVTKVGEGLYRPVEHPYAAALSVTDFSVGARVMSDHGVSLDADVFTADGRMTGHVFGLATLDPQAVAVRNWGDRLVVNLGNGADRLHLHLPAADRARLAAVLTAAAAALLDESRDQIPATI